MRFVWVLVSALVCACVALGTGVVMSTLQPLGEEALPRAARLAFSSDLSATRRLLALSCERDAQIERVLLELSAGALETDAARIERTLARSLGGAVQLLVEQTGSVKRLKDGGEVELSPLRRALRERVASADAEPALLDACVSGRAGIRLWIVRRLAVSSLLREAGIEPSLLELEQVAAGSSGARRQTKQEIAWFPSLEAGELRVRVRDDRRHADALILPLSLCLGAALALGALLGFWLTRERPVDDTVLATLEQAAERVASGDLSSQIGLRLGGRADQTFRSFDRMTAELRETRAKLAEAERAAAWQDMAQRIAHEIKNPLSPIKLSLETLRKAHAKRLGSFDEIFEESTRAMLEEVARMERILREFSDFARLPRARPGALELGRLVHDTVSLYAPDDVSVQLLIDPTPTQVHADREQLVQVVVNLLANALDAARTNPTPRVQLSTRKEGAQVVLAVDDNGPGVAPSERERIFEPYVTSKDHGTGLGLSIVRRIVLDHGGSLSVGESALLGARFELRLPASGAQSASMP